MNRVNSKISKNCMLIFKKLNEQFKFKKKITKESPKYLKKIHSLIVHISE